VNLAPMARVIRAQMAVDQKLLADAAQGRTVLGCGWDHCHHAATRDGGADASARPLGHPRFECHPHAEFGEAYEEVRAAGAIVFGGAQSLVGAFKRLVASGDVDKHAATSAVIDGVRVAVAGQRRKH
jgi:hypothetical protein